MVWRKLAHRKIEIKAHLKNRSPKKRSALLLLNQKIHLGILLTWRTDKLMRLMKRCKFKKRKMCNKSRSHLILKLIKQSIFSSSLLLTFKMKKIRCLKKSFLIKWLWRGNLIIVPLSLECEWQQLLKMVWRISSLKILKGSRLIKMMETKRVNLCHLEWGNKMGFIGSFHFMIQKLDYMQLKNQQSLENLQGVEVSIRCFQLMKMRTNLWNILQKKVKGKIAATTGRLNTRNNSLLKFRKK